MIWNSNIINLAIDEYSKGNPIAFLESPYYKLNVDIKKANLLFQYTQEEIQELANIKNSNYFVKKYLNFIPYNFQDRILDNIQSEKFNIVACARQTGMSKISCASVFHMACTETDKNIVIVTNSSDSSSVLINRIQQFYLGLPFYMKPGVCTWNKTSITFDNGCKIKAVTSAEAATGAQIHFLVVQDAAFINKFHVFTESLFPVMTSMEKSKILLYSQLNGYDKFYEICINALNQINNFKLNVVNWFDVPTRDELWKQKEIQNLGSEELFNEQYIVNLETANTNQRITEHKKEDQLDILKREISALLKRIEVLEKRNEY